MVPYQNNESRTASDDYGNAAFNDTPEREPGCGGLAAGLGFPADLSDTERSDCNEDDTDAEESHYA